MKRIIRLLLMVLILSCLAVLPVFADGNGTQGENSGTVQTVQNEGYNSLRSGFLMYVVDKNGVTKTDILMLTVQGDYPKAATSKGLYWSLKTKFGAVLSPDDIDTIYLTPWGFGPITDNWSGRGKDVKNWLIEPDPEYYQKSARVLSEYFQYTAEDITNFGNNEDYLIVESFIWRFVL